MAEGRILFPKCLENVVGLRVRDHPGPPCPRLPPEVGGRPFHLLAGGGLRAGRHQCFLEFQEFLRAHMVGAGGLVSEEAGGETGRLEADGDRHGARQGRSQRHPVRRRELGRYLGSFAKVSHCKLRVGNNEDRTGEKG